MLWNSHTFSINNDSDLLNLFDAFAAVIWEANLAWKCAQIYMQKRWVIWPTTPLVSYRVVLEIRQGKYFCLIHVHVKKRKQMKCNLTCYKVGKFKKLTIRAFALRQSEWRNCGLCACVFMDRNGATLLVGIWWRENKNKSALVDTVGIKSAIIISSNWQFAAFPYI